MQTLFADLKNSIQPYKAQKFFEIDFWRVANEPDGSDFVKQEFGSLPNAKIWEVDFRRMAWIHSIQYLQNPKAFGIDFWMVILALSFGRFLVL